MKLRVVRADPAGNVTLFVLDPVARAERPAVAARLMELRELAAEQVGFACPPPEGFDGRMEMAGGEFCGNASRAYGMLLARRRGVVGAARLRLSVSGSDTPVTVEVDTAAGIASASMPSPRIAGRYTVDGAEGVMVDLGGIVHFVTRRAPDERVLERAEAVFLAPRERGGFAGAEAYGVMFLHEGRMTPLVRVPAAGTTVWEGSCGSGSLACAAAESGAADGVFARDYVQPSGVIRATVERRGGVVTSASIGGTVTLDDPILINL